MNAPQIAAKNLVGAGQAGKVPNSLKAKPNGFYVYVIELPDEVAPRQHADKPSLYLGSTGRFIRQRFKRQKSGK